MGKRIRPREKLALKKASTTIKLNSNSNNNISNDDS